MDTLFNTHLPEIWLYRTFFAKIPHSKKNTINYEHFRISVWVLVNDNLRWMNSAICLCTVRASTQQYCCFFVIVPMYCQCWNLLYCVSHLQVIVIFAFATCAGFIGDFKFKETCPAPNKNISHSVNAKFYYPFSTMDIYHDIPLCSGEEEKTHLALGSVNESSSQFFVFTGVVAMLFVFVAVIFYLVFEDQDKDAVATDIGICSFPVVVSCLTLLLSVIYCSSYIIHINITFHIIHVVLCIVYLNISWYCEAHKNILASQKRPRKKMFHWKQTAVTIRLIINSIISRETPDWSLILDACMCCNQTL